MKELAKSMLAAKSFNQTSKPAELDRWLGILAEELATRLSEDCAAHSRAPRGLSLSYRCLLGAQSCQVNLCIYGRQPQSALQSYPARCAGSRVL